LATCRRKPAGGTEAQLERGIARRLRRACTHARSRQYLSRTLGGRSGPTRARERADQSTLVRPRATPLRARLRRHRARLLASGLRRKARPSSSP
jgi:hypothetical protein